VACSSKAVIFTLWTPRAHWRAPPSPPPGHHLRMLAVDRALMGSMAGERMNKSFGREVREKEMS
jgi:hypothetical protein